jgi:predicted RNA-binding protein YlxR (DUF448 family)
VAGKQRRDPTRTCVACRQAQGRRGLLRVARVPDGAVVYDAGGRAPGRGAYLHADAECIQLARRRRALDRALKTQVPEHLWADLAAAAGQPP